MTLGELKERALVTADEEGNEVEYASQLIEAINKVQNKLVVFARPQYKYEDVEAIDGVLELPSDCFELVEIRNSNLNQVSYKKINNKQIQIADGTYNVKYKAFLPSVTSDTLEDFEIEIEPIAEECMVVGVAMWIAVDNPELYDILSAEFNNLLANLSRMGEVVNDNSNGIERLGGYYW